MKTVGAMLMAVVAAACISGCGGGGADEPLPQTQDPRLFGRWAAQNLEYESTMVLSEDGTYSDSMATPGAPDTLGIQTGTWATSGDTLILTDSSGHVMELDYSVSSDGNTFIRTADMASFIRVP